MAKAAKQKTARISLSERIKAFLSRNNRETAGIINQDTHWTAPYLFDILVWQQIKDKAENELKLAWERANLALGLVSDDNMRQRLGERTLVSTPDYVLTVKVGNPGRRFDQDAFVDALCAKYRGVRADDVLALIEETKKEDKPRLTKRVLEATVQ